MFTEDLQVFLADFGVTAEVGGLRARVLMDAPDANILGDRVQTTNYSMTYIDAELPRLNHGDWINVDGRPYSVQSVSAIEDGVFKVATLERTRS